MNNVSIGASFPTFKDFWDLGYNTRLIPIVPHDAVLYEESQLARRKDARGKAPGIRRADGKWGGLDWIHYEADEQDLKRWQEMSAGVGVKTGEGLVLIDADTMDEGYAKTIKECIEKHFGQLPIRVGRYPKAGYPLRISEAIKYTRVEFGTLERVEVLSDGRQFVAHGIHPVTKAPYTWPRGIPRYEEIPVVAAAAVKEFLEELRALLPAAKEIVTEGSATARATIDQASLKGDIELVTKAIRALPNTTALFPTHDDYIKPGYALKAALPDHPDRASELYAEWCDKWVDPAGRTNDPNHIKGVWRSFKGPFEIGANWLYDHADKYSDGDFSKAHVFFSLIEDTPPSPFDAQVDLNDSKRRSGRLAPIPFEIAADAALTTSARPLIKGLLDGGAMTVTYGDSNVGKTFVVMDMAFHIATGCPYAGMRTAHLPVAYIAAEGGNGARRRIRALRDKHGIRAKSSKFFLLAYPVNLLRPEADLSELIAELVDLAKREGPIGLVVVDTLSRALAGGDENSSVDMGSLITNLDRLRRVTGAHLMMIHHTGKDKARGARGHSMLRAATDTEIEIAENEIKVTKQRDLEREWSTGFRLEVRTLGEDGDGDPITSCTVELVSRHEARGAMTPTEKALLDILSECQRRSAASGKGIPPAELAEAAVGQVEITVGSVRTHLQNLQRKGHVEKVAAGRWLARTPIREPCSYFNDVSAGGVTELPAQQSARENERDIFY